jgi:hypothetical protein
MATEKTFTEVLNDQAGRIFYELDGLKVTERVVIAMSPEGRIVVRFESNDASEQVSGVNSRDALSQISQVLACRV